MVVARHTIPSCDHSAGYNDELGEKYVPFSTQEVFCLLTIEEKFHAAGPVRMAEPLFVCGCSVP